MERELLSIVETQKEFRNILLGQNVVVYTDHRNLVHETTMMSSQRVMRWRLLLEEYGPEIKYIKGKANSVAGSLSRLDISGSRLSLDELEECFGPTQSDDDLFPMSTKLIAQEQRADKELTKQLKADLQGFKYTLQSVDGFEVVMCDGKIYIPPSL